MLEKEFIRKAEGGKIVIDIPEEYEGKDFKVSVKPIEIDLENEELWHLLPGKERLKILQRFKGTARYPNVDIDKNEVYEQ